MPAQRPLRRRNFFVRPKEAKILSALTDKWQAAKDIADACGLTKYSASQALTALTAARYVTREKRLNTESNRRMFMYKAAYPISDFQVEDQRHCHKSFEKVTQLSQVRLNIVSFLSQQKKPVRFDEINCGSTWFSIKTRAIDELVDAAVVLKEEGNPARYSLRVQL